MTGRIENERGGCRENDDEITAAMSE